MIIHNSAKTRIFSFGERSVNMKAHYRTGSAFYSAF